MTQNGLLSTSISDSVSVSSSCASLTCEISSRSSNVKSDEVPENDPLSEVDSG